MAKLKSFGYEVKIIWKGSIPSISEKGAIKEIKRMFYKDNRIKLDNKEIKMERI